MKKKVEKIQQKKQKKVKKSFAPPILLSCYVQSGLSTQIIA
jgi:hypothetical protein